MPRKTPQKMFKVISALVRTACKVGDPVTALDVYVH